jgi:uncharacterized repeat protein (TIGR01451 family)
MVPGNTYYLDIDPSDPAFGEIVATAAIHLDESGALISDIFEQIKAEDDVWSEPIPANHTVRVTFETELADGNVIDFIGRTNGSLVDVEIYVVNTGTLVGASRRFDHQMHEFIELSGVPSPTDTFDLKIIGLPTPECSPDDDCGFSDSAPLMEFDFINDAAISATGADGVVGYSTNLTLQPHYREWNRTTQLWGAQGNALTNTGQSNWIVMKSSHQFNHQFLMGALQIDANISLQIGNGYNSTTNTTNWTQRINLSFEVPSTTARSLDIAIEDISGSGIVIFETRAAADSVFALREWNGTALGANITVNISVPAGGVQWLRAIPRTGTNEVMILALTANSDLWATYWTGSGLLNNTGFNITLDTGINTREVFDFAWQQDGNGTLVYRQGAQTQINFRTFNATNRAWSANASFIDLTPGLPQDMRLCPDPTSNYIGFISHDSTDDANVRIWNGTNIETSPAPPAENIDLELTGAPARNVDCAWFPDGSNATFVFVQAPAASDDLFAYVMYNKTAWNPGSLATPTNSTSVTGGPSIEELDLIPNPVRREIQAVVLDAVLSADAFSALFNFTNWAVNPAGNYFLETTVTAACAGTTMCAGFDWDNFDPVPNVTIITPSSGEGFLNGSNINITVNVTDNLFVANVTVNVTQPDNTVARFNMTLFQGNTTVGNWTVNFTNTTLSGRYNFTVCANDTSTHMNVNCTTSFFNTGNSANVSVVKTDFPDPVAPGGILFYTVTITNAGALSANNVTVVETYPGNVTFNSSQPAPTSGNNTFSLGTLLGNTSTTINITLNVSRAVNNITLSNFVNVTFANASGQNTTVNATASTLVQGPNVTITKFDVPDPVVRGALLLYLIQYNVSFMNVTNNLSIDSPDFLTNNSLEHDSPNAIRTSNQSIIIVYSEVNGTTGFDVFAKRSVDNGQTFTTQQLTTDLVGSDEVPNIMQANDNTVYVVFANISANGSGDIYILNSTNDGQSWGSSKILLNTTTVSEYEPSLEQNSTGTYFLLYEAVIAPDTDSEIWIRNSTNLVNFSAPINLTANSIFDVDPDILVGVNDTVFITWAPGNGVNGTQIIQLVNTTNPLQEGLLNNYTVISNTSFYDYEPSIFQSNSTTCGGNNNIYISWVRLTNSSQLSFSDFNRTSNEIFIARSLNLGATFTTYQSTNNNISDTYPGLIQEGATDFFQISFLRAGTSEMEVALGTVGVRPGDAFNVTITDVVPNNTTLVNGSIIGGGNASGNTITWNFPQLFECQSGFVGFIVRVNESLANGTVINNSANVTYYSSSGVNNTGNASANTTVQGIPVTVTIKNDNPDPVIKGTLLNYTILINNTGDEIAYNVTLVDTYPPNVSFVSSSPAPTSGNDTFSLGNLLPNQSTTVNITVRVGTILTNGTIITNLANATFTNLSGVNSSSSDTETTTIQGIPTVFTNKTDSPDPVVKGTTLSYQILVNNTGDEIAYNVTVVENYSSSVVFNGSQPAPTFGNNTWNVGNILNGSFTTINITVNVSPAVANGSIITNNYNVTFANLTGTNLTVTNSTTTTVQGIPVTVTIKSDNPDPVIRGQTLNYSILINNTGDEIAYNVTLVDVYPPNVSFVSSSPSPTAGNGTFSLGNLSPNQSTTVNITVTVGPTVLNGTVLSNLANATFANLSGSNSSSSDTETTTVIGFPQVFANKSDSPDPVVNGTTLSYQITINNNGDEIAYNISVFDLYPSQVTFNGSTPAPSSGNNTWTIGNLTNGSSTTINITVNVSAGNGSVLNNSFNVTFANFSGVNTTITNSTTTTVQGVGVLVTIKNDNPDPVIRGQNLSYSILVNNTGDEIAYNVTLVDVYPPNVSFVSSSPSPTAGNGTFSLGNLSPNQSTTVNITVTVGPTVRNGTVLNNLANATFANLSGANSSASDTESTTVIGFPEIFTNKSDSPDPVVNGTTLTYQILINNAGDEIAYNVTVFDLYPITGVTFNGSSPSPNVSNNTWFLGTLLNGSFTTINITVNVSAGNGSVLNNSYNVTFANFSGTNLTITNSSTTTVQGIGVIVTIKNDNPDPVVRGSNLNYTILVNNTGDEVAYNVTLVDTYPPNVSFVSSSPSPTSGNNTFSLGNLSPNQSTTVNITVTVGLTVVNGTVLNNLANATFTNLSGANASASDTESTTVVGFPEVFANKSDSPDPVFAGFTLSYQILINNTGDEIAYNVTVFDLYPPNVTFNGSSPAPSSGNDTWNLGTLLNGSSTTINITVNVSAATDNGSVLNNSFNVTFANNSGVNLTITNSTNTTVLNQGFNFTNVTVAKTDSPDPVVRGQLLNYTITVNSTGNATAVNVTVLDIYPPNVSFVSSSPSPTSGNDTFFLGNITNGTSTTINITVSVGPFVLNGTVLNNSVNATFNETNGTNHSASTSELTTVIGFPEVFTNKTDTPDPVVNGTTLSYQILITNTGDEIAYNATVFDLYPTSGVTFNGSSPSPNVSNNTWFLGNLLNGSSTTINITVNVSAANGTVLNNSYNVTFANFSGVNLTITNSTTTTVQGVGVIVTIKSDTPDPVVRGQLLNYSILVNNTGDEIVYNVTLVDVYPPNVSFVSSSPSPTTGNGTFALGNFSPNQSILVNITVLVGPTVLNGTVLFNLANVTFTNVSGANASASDNETTTVAGFAEVFANKSDSPDPVVNGSTLSYQITIVNTGDEIAYNVTVFDLYPLFGVTFNGSSPAPNVSNNTWLFDALVNGSSTTINITVNVSAANGTVLNNSFNVTFANTSGVNLTITNSTTTTVQGIPFLVSIKSDTPDPVVRGQTLNYTILVNNTGTEIAYNVTLVDTYPPNVSFVTSSPAPTIGNGTFGLGNLSPNQSTTVNISVTVGPTALNGTVLVNLANATFANLSGANSSASDTESTTVIGFPEVFTNKSDTPDPIFSGSTLSYQILINNTGDEFAYNVTAVETYPPNVTFNGSSPAPSSGNDTFSVGNLSPGGFTTINITVNVSFSIPNGTLLNNSYNVTFSNSSGQNSTITNSTLTLVLVNVTNITVTKTDNPDPVLRGTQLNYTITITNIGLLPAFNVTVFDIYPGNVSFHNASPSPNVSNNTWFLGTLSAGNSTTINITVNVSSAVSNGTILNNTVIVNHTDILGIIIFTATDSELTTVLGERNLTISKTDDPDPVASGATLSYQILINNTGDDTAFNVTVIEIYPVNVTFNGSSPAPSSGNNTFSLGNLAPNQSTTINITVNVSSAMTSGILNNTVFANASNFFGTNQTVNDSELTTVIPAGMNVSNITLTKSDSPDPVIKGQQLNYTIVVNSTGNGTAFNVTVIEGYPSGVVFHNSSPAPTSGNGTFDLGNLTNGTVFIINITVNVSSSLTNGTVLNNTVNSTFQFSNGENGTATDSELTTVIGFPEIFTNKSDSPDPVVNGTTLTYQILINNTGDEIAYNVTVFDLYPTSGVTFNGSSPSPNVSNNTWFLGTLLNGSFTTINITVNVSAANGTILNNSYNVTFANFSGVNLTVTNSTTTTVQGIGVIVTIKNDNPDPVVRGSTLNYSILVNNTGDEIAYNVTLVDAYPPNVSFVTSSPAPTVGNNTFSLGNLSPNQSILVNISVAVGPTVLNGTILTNLANATFSNLSGANSSSSDAESTTVSGFAEVFANKSSSPNPVVNGTTLSYQILITNTGDEIAYNVTVVDIYPVSGVTFNGSSPAPDVGNTTWFLGNLTNGSSTTINITVNVSAANGTVLNNSFNVTFANTSGVNLTITNSTTTTVQGIGVIVTIKNDNPDPVVRGSTLNYSILVNNTGDEIAYNVTLVDTYPSNVSFVTSSPAPTVGNNTFSLGNLSPNQSILVNISVTVGSTVLNGTILTNLANATFANLSGANASASDTESTTVIGFPEVFTNKSDSPDPVANGSTLSYQILITNTGDEIAYNVTVVETYPPNVTFNGSSPAPDVGNDTWFLGNLSPNVSTTINITVNVSISNNTVLNNSYNVTFVNNSGTNFTVTNNTLTTALVSGVNITNVSVTKTDNPDPVLAGTQLNYTITINNSGNATALNVTVVDGYPSGVVFHNSSPAPTSGNDTFFIGNLTNGSSTTINITVNVSSALSNGTILNNTVNVSHINTFGVNVTTNTSELTTVRGQRNLTISKTDDPDPVASGATLSYQILVNNTGDDTAFNVTVIEIYPVNVTFNGSSPAPTSGNNTFSLGNLEPNQSTTINITVNVSGAMTSGILNNTVFANASNFFGTNQTVNDTEDTTVIPAGLNVSNITLTKLDSPDPVIKGQQLNYSILVNSTGNGTAFNVTIIEGYPSGVVFHNSSPAPTGGNGTFALGDLANGTEFVINITVNVSSSLANGTILNNTVNSTFQFSNGANGTSNDSETTTVIGFPIVNVTKADSPDPVTNGSLLFYTITITNSGDEIAYNVTLVEDYPANVTLFSTSPAPDVGNNTFFLGNLTPGGSTTVNISVSVSGSMTSGVLIDNVNVSFLNASGVNSTINASANTTVIPFVPPPPPPSGGGGGGSNNAESALIVPPKKCVDGVRTSAGTTCCSDAYCKSLGSAWTCGSGNGLRVCEIKAYEVQEPFASVERTPLMPIEQRKGLIIASVKREWPWLMAVIAVALIIILIIIGARKNKK